MGPSEGSDGLQPGIWLVNDQEMVIKQEMVLGILVM